MIKASRILAAYDYWFLILILILLSESQQSGWRRRSEYIIDVAREGSEEKDTYPCVAGGAGLLRTQAGSRMRGASHFPRAIFSSHPIILGHLGELSLW